MAKGPTTEQLGRLRWLAIAAISALFVTDYGFDIFKKPVPELVYVTLGAIAIGVDVGQLRDLLVQFLKSFIGVADNNKDDKK